MHREGIYMELNAASMVDACRDDGRDAGVSIRSTLEPLAGAHAPVKPATYAGGVFQEDVRWWGSPPQRTNAIVIDNVPSQANRLEAALQQMSGELGLPEIVLDLSALPALPPHLPKQLSSFRFPHRHADAYLRDAADDGSAFKDTDIGRSLLNATVDAPAAILHWFPQALLFGFWQSHLGNKRSQAKLARSWVSEIVGYGPATDPGARTRPLGLKGDELNLSVDEQAEFQGDDLIGSPWSLVEGTTRKEKTQGQSRKALSEIGHGQVPVGGSGSTALTGVSFQAIEQQATLSLAGLRRIHFGSAETNATGRALLAALALVAHACAFGSAVSLRSGCELRAVQSTRTWLGASEDSELAALDVPAAVALFNDCRGAAAAAGLLEGGWGKPPLRLTPASNLAHAIKESWPLPALGA